MVTQKHRRTEAVIAMSLCLWANTLDSNLQPTVLACRKPQTQACEGTGLSVLDYLYVKGIRRLALEAGQ